MRASPGTPLAERLSLYTAKQPDGCWIWTGSKISSGYGVIRVAGRTRKAHQIALEVAGQALIAGLEIDHLCHNRACINPTHLRQVSRVENVRNSSSPGGLNARKTHCPRGHPYEGENLLTYASDNGRRCKECRRASLRR